MDADEDIATYFPWVIHEDEFPGLSIHTRIGQEALSEIASQVVSAEAEEEPSIEMANSDQILRMLNIGHKEILDGSGGALFIESEIVRAKHSQNLWKVYQSLKRLMLRPKQVAEERHPYG